MLNGVLTVSVNIVTCFDTGHMQVNPLTAYYDTG